MNTRLIAAVILGSFVLAGCGGGSSDTAQDEADMQVADAQQERIDELEEDLADAQEQARLEQAAKEREQAEKERLEQEAADAEARARLAESSIAYNGLEATAVGANDPIVTPKYRSPAALSVPEVTFASGGTGATAGRWYRTTFSNRGPSHEDDIVVYSDVGAPTPTPIRQIHEDFAEEGTSSLVVTIMNTHQDLIYSSSFPKGGHTDTISPTVDTDANTEPDLTHRISGTFDGVSGYFLCSGTGENACSVEHTGKGYVLSVGTWTFHTSRSARVNVPDANFMHFGWWKRKTFANGGSFSYRTFKEVHGESAAGGSFDALQDQRPMTAPRSDSTPSTSRSVRSRTMAASRRRPR